MLARNTSVVKSCTLTQLSHRVVFCHLATVAVKDNYIFYIYMLVCVCVCVCATNSFV